MSELHGGRDETSFSNEESLATRFKHFIFGHPKDPTDVSVFHKLSLIPFLAWIGLGADGLSSSSYGPEECFKTLGDHTYLAVGLTALVATTVIIISAAYSRIIEQFPHGGGGYVVATKLLGKQAGVVSGCALLVDYVLTITVSIASAGDVLFSFIPLHWHGLKLPFQVCMIVVLTMMNIRGARESVLILAPIFLLFLVTHVAAIVWGFVGHVPYIAETSHQVTTGFSNGMGTLGAAGMLLLFVHAYSLGGGTYTGLEAVSNGLPIMREPRVKTAQRTMVYMASSLAFTAGGLLLCYLLWHVSLVPGKTMNAVFLERLSNGLFFSGPFVVLTLITEGALLIVAAQAGFIDGPRVLANMATDYWMPTKFAALSERLTTQNGILLMGLASTIALLYAKGNVSVLVVMYSINVFLTFSLSMFGMAGYWFKARKRKLHWRRRLALFCVGFALCATILVITTMEKFKEGGWITVTITALLILLCFAIQRHYRTVGKKLVSLPARWSDLPRVNVRPFNGDGREHVAAILVGGFGGFGVQTVNLILNTFEGQFTKLVFLSVGVVDSGGFKGAEAVDELKANTQQVLQKYLDLAASIGIPATSKMAIGTDTVAEAERLCKDVAREAQKVTFFAGKVVFQKESWYQKILHNETATAIQKRLQWDGLTLVILPVKVA